MPTESLARLALPVLLGAAAEYEAMRALDVYTSRFSSIVGADIPEGGLRLPLARVGITVAAQYERLQEILHTPTAREFWTLHAHKWTPLILRDAATSMAASHTWNDAEYVNRSFGHMVVRVEPAREDRRARRDVLQMELSEFLWRSANGEELYVVSTVPHLMTADLQVPPFLLCGRSNKVEKRAGGARATSGSKTDELASEPPRWATPIDELGLWISQTPTSSQIHYDQTNILNCLLVGEKQWVFIDTRSEHDKLPWAEGRIRGVSANTPLYSGSDFVDLDPLAIDVTAHARLRGLKLQVATQRAGDCFFIPHGYTHQVTKASAGLAVAVSFLWERDVAFSADDCALAPTSVPIPLSAYLPTWYFSGRGLVPLGYPVPSQVRKDLALFVHGEQQDGQQGAQHGGKRSTPQRAQRLEEQGVQHEEQRNEQRPRPSSPTAAAFAVWLAHRLPSRQPAGARGAAWFSHLDSNTDGLLSLAEVESADARSLLLIGLEMQYDWHAGAVYETAPETLELQAASELHRIGREHQQAQQRAIAFTTDARGAQFSQASASNDAVASSCKNSSTRCGEGAQCLHSDGEAQTAAAPLPRYANLTESQFEQLVTDGTPFIVVDIAASTRGWRMDGWTCEYLRARFPTARVITHYTDSGDVESRLREVMDAPPQRATRATGDGPAFCPQYWPIKEAALSDDEGPQGVEGAAADELSARERESLQAVRAATALPSFMASEALEELRATPELWLAANGAGAQAHADKHCESTLSIQLSGTKRWRLSLPPEPRGISWPKRSLADGAPYSFEGGWKPSLVGDLRAGDALVFPPGYIHETVGMSDECATSVTYQFNTPPPLRHARTLYGRLRRTWDLRRCWRPFSLFATQLLRRAMPLGAAYLGGVLPAAARKAGLERHAALDGDGDGCLAVAELPSANAPSPAAWTRALHRALDDDLDGCVSAAEVGSVLERWAVIERTAVEEAGLPSAAIMALRESALAMLV